MDSAVDAMAAAYDALFDAIAAFIAGPPCRQRALQDVKRRLDAFTASCDQADELLRAAADRVALSAGTAFLPSPSPSPQAATGGGRLDALFRAVQAIHLQAEQQDNSLTTPPSSSSPHGS